MKNFPTNDEEYDKLLERIVKGAEYLENPLIKPEDYEKGMKLYDGLCAVAIEYRRRCSENRPEHESRTKSIHPHVHVSNHKGHTKTA